MISMTGAGGEAAGSGRGGRIRLLQPESLVILLVLESEDSTDMGFVPQPELGAGCPQITSSPAL